MIQDIAPHHYHNEYHHFEIQKGDCVLFYRKREGLLADDVEQIVYYLFFSFSVFLIVCSEFFRSLLFYYFFLTL